VGARKQDRVVYSRLTEDFPEPLREHHLRQVIGLARHVAEHDDWAPRGRTQRLSQLAAGFRTLLAARPPVTQDQGAGGRGVGEGEHHPAQVAFLLVGGEVVEGGEEVDDRAAAVGPAAAPCRAVGGGAEGTRPRRRVARSTGLLGAATQGWCR